MAELSDRLAVEFDSGVADLERPSSLAAIPNPGEDLASLSRTVRAIKAVVDQLTGAAGSALDKALTPRDMLDEGALSFSPSTGLVAAAPVYQSVTGDGGGGGPPDYEDPRPIPAIPYTPTDLVVYSGFKIVVLTWNLVDFRNYAYVEIWRNTTNNLGTAALYDTSIASVYTDANVTNGVTYYYWVRSTNFEGVNSPFNATSGVSGGPLLIGTTDMSDGIITAQKLADGSVTATKVAALAIDQTKFANGIEPIAVVSGVPGSLVTRTIFNTLNGKLYRWNGTSYVFTVPSTDISGTLTDAQIASISAAKLTGQITNTQIADNSISTPKLQAGSVTTNEIAAATIVAGDIAASTILGTNIAANTITGTNILANSVNADRLVANSITAGQIQAGAIGTNQLAANAVTVGKLLVTGQGMALNDDPGLIDPDIDSSWAVFDSTNPRTRVELSDGKTGPYALLFTVPNSASKAAVRSRRFPISSAKTYKVSMWMRVLSGTPSAYLRLRQFPADFSSSFHGPVTALEPFSSGTFEGFAASSASGWVRYSGYVTPSLANVAWGAVEVYGSFLSAATVQCQDIRCEEYIGYDLIVDGAIIANKLAANSVVAGKIAADAIAAVNIIGGTITGDKIAAGTITGTNIQGATITGTQIAGSTITGTKIAANTITGGNIQANSVNADRLVAGSITATQIGAGQIDATKINVSSLSALSANLGNVTAGILTGALIRTATSGTRIEFGDGANPSVNVYGNIGAGLMVTARLGQDAAGSSAVAVFGSLTSGVAYSGLVGRSYGGDGGYFESISSNGVRAVSSTGAAIRGSSTSGFGAQLESNATSGALWIPQNSVLPSLVSTGQLTNHNGVVKITSGPSTSWKPIINANPTAVNGALTITGDGSYAEQIAALVNQIRTLLINAGLAS